MKLAPLVALLLFTAVAAILLLQGVLNDIKRIDPLTLQAIHADSWLGWFRWIVLGLAVVFLVVINISVVLLFRTSSMVLQPVDKLIHATRELAAEHFDYRVSIEQHDEFDELAQAYNSLAEQLQSNDRLRIETLGQVAVTMNHELNNSIAIIDLQLAKLSRQTSGGPALEKCLRQIQESLQRMTKTIQSLKNIRRIVLTDYAPGMKMLDLQKSVEEEQQPEGAGVGPVASGAHGV